MNKDNVFSIDPNTQDPTVFVFKAEASDSALVPKAQVDMWSKAGVWEPPPNVVWPQVNRPEQPECTTQHTNMFFHPELAESHAYLTSIGVPSENVHGTLGLKQRIEFLYNTGRLAGMMREESTEQQKPKAMVTSQDYPWQQPMTEDSAPQVLTQLLNDLSNRVRLFPNLKVTRGLRSELSKLVGQILDL